MKKFLSLITALIITLSCLSALGVAFAISPIGDVNEDGDLDIVDVALTRGYIIHNITFSINEFNRADMNDDNTVDIVDVVLMRYIIVNGGFDVYDESGVVVSDEELTLYKGSGAVVYIETINFDDLVVEPNSDLFEIIGVHDDKNNKIGIAIFVKDNADTDVTDTIKVYLKDNEKNYKEIKVTVSTEEGVEMYFNNPAVPDFGTYCGVMPYFISLDGSYYTYLTDELLDIYTEDELKDLYLDFGAVLEMNGYELNIYTGINGGEISHYVSADEKTSIEYGVVTNDGLEQIFIGITYTEN